MRFLQRGLFSLRPVAYIFTLWKVSILFNFQKVYESIVINLFG